MLIRVIIGDNVRYHRKMKNMSQEELGARIEMTQNMISKIETHKQNLTIDMLETLCGGLDVDLFDLAVGNQKLPKVYFFTKTSLTEGVIEILYQYFMIVTKLNDKSISSEPLDTYGIELKGRPEICVADISTNREFVSSLVELFNRLQLDPVHIDDVIRDAVG